MVKLDMHNVNNVKANNNNNPTLEEKDESEHVDLLLLVEVDAKVERCRRQEVLFSMTTIM